MFRIFHVYYILFIFVIQMFISYFDVVVSNN